MGRRLRKLLQLSLGWCLRKRRPSIRCVQCRGSLEGSVLSIQEAQAPDRERTPRLCWAMGRVGARGWLGTGSGLPPGPGLFLEHKPLLCAQCPAKDGGGSRWGGEGPLVSPRWVCVGKLQPRRRLWIDPSLMGRIPPVEACIPHSNPLGARGSQPTGHPERHPFDAAPLSPGCSAPCRRQEKKQEVLAGRFLVAQSHTKDKLSCEPLPPKHASNPERGQSSWKTHAPTPWKRLQPRLISAGR